MSEDSPNPELKKIDKTYDIDHLRTLKGLDAVREKPGMYIGGRDKRALHRCIDELLDHSMGEFLAGHCTHIDVSIHVDGSTSIKDNGRGIPVDINRDSGLSGVEVALTVLHTGREYGKDGYAYATGAHGVGAKCVNAVSEWFKVEVLRDGKIHAIAFERGQTTQKLRVIGEVENRKTTGTHITFKPDAQIFQEGTEFDGKWVCNRLHELAYNHPKLTFTFTDERSDASATQSIRHPRGIAEWLENETAHRKDFCLPLIPITGTSGPISIQIAAQYRSSSRGFIQGIVNETWGTNGSHCQGFIDGLREAVRHQVKVHQLSEGQNCGIKNADVLRSLIAIVRIVHPDPRFISSFKVTMYSREGESFIRQCTKTALAQYFEEHPTLAKKIARNCLRAARTRQSQPKRRIPRRLPGSDM